MRLPMESHHTLTRTEYGKTSSYLMLLQQTLRGIRAIGPSLWTAANFFLFPLEGEKEQTENFTRLRAQNWSLPFSLQISLLAILSRNRRLILSLSSCYLAKCIVILSSKIDLLYRKTRVHRIRKWKGWEHSEVSVETAYLSSLLWLPTHPSEKCWVSNLTSQSPILSLTALLWLLTSHVCFIHFSCAGTHRLVSIYTTCQKVGPYYNIVPSYF